jgi:hypothetical protein
MPTHTLFNVYVIYKLHIDIIKRIRETLKNTESRIRLLIFLAPKTVS